MYKSKSGTVVSVEPFTVLLDGESIAKSFKRLKSYIPQIDDRVICISDGDSYIVIGGVI